jgi:UDP-glucuronate 4-epimerase
MQALVTGCAGFIGSHLTESLLSDGYSVVGVDCFNNNYGRRQKLKNLDIAREYDGFEFLPLDLSSGDLDDLIPHDGIVFHLAAEPGVRTSWGDRFASYVRSNIQATHQLLNACSRISISRFVYASSSSIYGDAESLPTHETATPAPVSPYGLTKLAGEHLCHAYEVNHGVSSLSLRFFTVFGPRQRPDMAFHIFCRAVLAKKPIRVYGDGKQSRDFTFVKDIVQALRASGTCKSPDHKVYNVGGGTQTSLNKAIELIAEYSGQNVEIEYLQRESGDVHHTSADTSRAKCDLGYTPSTDLRSGLQAEFNWMTGVVDD